MSTGQSITIEKACFDGLLKVDGMNIVLVVIDKFTKYTMLMVAPDNVYNRGCFIEIWWGILKCLLILLIYTSHKQVLDNIIQHDGAKLKFFYCKSFVSWWDVLLEECAIFLQSPKILGNKS